MLPETLPNRKSVWEKPSFKRVDDPARVIAVLAGLDPVEYDSIREKQAKSLNIRVSTLDTEVYKLRPRDPELDNSSLVEEFEPWYHPVEITDLLDSVCSLLNKHVVLPNGAATALTLWIAGTYVYDSFRIWPKLTITSPEKRCGKTTLLEVLSALCNRALVASNISPAAVFRVINRCTPSLLIDEADTFLNNNDLLRGVINSGHTKSTAFVIRTTGDDHEPAKFSTWCPMVISMIKLPPDTILDRSVVIQLRRKLPGESTQKITQTLVEDCQIIRRKFARWSIDLSTTLKNVNPALPKCGNDRALDNWTPLFAIAESSDPGWIDKTHSSFGLLVSTDDDDAIGPMILKDIQSIFEVKNKSNIFTAELVDELVALEDRPWCEWKHGKPLTQNTLSRLLKPFKIKSQSIRIGTIAKRGYYKKSFQDSFDRYLSLETSFQSATPPQPSNHAAYSRNQSATQKDHVALIKSLQPTDDKGCGSVALQNPIYGEGSIPNSKNPEAF